MSLSSNLTFTVECLGILATTGVDPSTSTGPRSGETGASAESVIGGRQESYRPKSWEHARDDGNQPRSIPTVFRMHVCTSDYQFTLKLLNKTIDVEFCVNFVSLMKNQLQGQNKCKYIYTSLFGSLLLLPGPVGITQGCGEGSRGNGVVKGAGSCGVMETRHKPATMGSKHQRIT